MRIGYGYDAHKLVKGRDLILAGEKINYEFGLLGHSDADVVTHSLIDAILGALCLGDIGKHFSDNDKRYKGINSLTLLKEVFEKYVKDNYKILNADISIVCQSPKLMNYTEKMEDNLKSIVKTKYINIKVTTEEEMGFTGRKEGISCHCVVLIKSLL